MRLKNDDIMALISPETLCYLGWQRVDMIIAHQLPALKLE